LDADFQWAESVAAFAEILKHSPYADLNALPAIGEALANPAHDAHPDRVEFRQLFNSASPLIATP
jgi:hypothetical protein